MLNPFEELLLKLNEIESKTNYLVEKLEAAEKPQQHTKEWMTINELTEELRISRSTVYKFFRNGELSYSKFGGKTMVSRTEVDRFMNSTLL